MWFCLIKLNSFAYAPFYIPTDGEHAESLFYLNLINNGYREK